ncbi:CCA tRNA nucleotidyltransferase [Sphingomonas sp.]|uniref:CCA tRNA nucleotidyltransferase n=1 Tax=Sphingomonas sp. TaxID=28214 RepID=UPI0035C79C7F
MDRVIAPARWEAFPGLAELVEALDADATRVVGGAVRDTLIGKPVYDVDLATRHAPEESMRRIKAAGLKAVPTGLKHGTVTAVLASGQPIEVTTLRRDVETDGRHAVVAFTDDWREDAARRDFTMNALYADVRTGAVHDHFDGLGDLAAGRVRFIGDPYQRIAEDHLRILRYFRFHARFGDAIDAAGLKACADRANDLMALSRERIAAELLRLLVAPAAVRVTALMVENGILRPVLPEIDAAGVARLAALAEREAAAGVEAEAVRRLAALLPAEVAEGIGGRLKLSNADRKRLVAATAGPGSEGPRALAYRCGPAIARDRLLLAGEDPAPIIGWAPPRLPISGGALVERGLVNGPGVAAALRALETRWIAEGFPDAARVAVLADEVVDQALRSTSNA